MGVLVGLDRLELPDILVGVQAGQVVRVARLARASRPPSAATAAAPAAAPRSRNDRRPGSGLRSDATSAARHASTNRPSSSPDAVPSMMLLEKGRDRGTRGIGRAKNRIIQMNPLGRVPGDLQRALPCATISAPRGMATRHRSRAISPGRRFRSTVPAGFERTPAGSSTGAGRSFQRHSTFSTSVRLRGNVEGSTSDTGGPPRA